jgi:hypothetical protein
LVYLSRASRSNDQLYGLSDKEIRIVEDATA